MNSISFFQQKKQQDLQTSGVIRGIATLLLLLVGSICWMPAQGQQTKSPVELGDQYFAAGDYLTAAHLYEQYLHPSKKQSSKSDFPLNIKGRRTAVPVKNNSRTDVLYKQAESYRLANYWAEAAAAYEECAQKDPSEFADAAYWYAVCQRSLGNYDNAWESQKKYLDAGGEKARYKADGEKELQTLLFIHQQLERPDSILVRTKKLSAPNSFEKGVFAPAFVGSNQFLVTSTQTDSVQVNGVNPFHSRLFYATLNNGNLETMMPANIVASEPGINQGAASVSADGKYLYFSQWKKEKGKTISSIYYSVKQSGGWSLPGVLSSINSEGYNSKQPFCTADGKYLFFSSDRPGGSGGFDIWYAPLNNDGTTGEPVNAGAAINTSNDEQSPFYQNSSTTLVFSSNGKQGMGGYDLFAAKGNETTWKPAENLGYPVNSARDDIYFFVAEKTPLLSNAIFSSDRGSGCCLETYNIIKAPKSKMLSGVLKDCADNAILGGGTIILKDPTGKTWTATTNAEGMYSFDLGNNSIESLTISASKELYLDKTAPFSPEKIDESDLLKDKLTNTDLCIDKKPEPKPVEQLVIKAENVVTVYFDFDKSVLKPLAVSRLDSIYNVLVENPGATIQISGYTDGLGSEAYNKILSDKRARACATYLVKKGIDSARVSFVSFGKCCPVEMEIINGRDNPDGRSLNRRALINVKKE